MPETRPEADGLRLCESAALTEDGPALLFDVRQYGRPLRAFALRHRGRVVAYLNRCLHVPVELDWQPGQFLDAERQHIVCAVHGATYDPQDGRCVAGPGGRGRLTAVEVREVDGRVYWYPSRDIRPATDTVPDAPPPRDSHDPR
ncbi:Rieske (2Fe-2S) protein [Aquabacterium sp. J223]|uniref:Rieske (2Fe-2S) protein n=1 Tax=Aquabacterium sp. J223 TaxID=2898431 RepID=UPI0021ADB9E7|nr:Rieske 2Fe-2S domain-containing protein [Aquabacterium sp. J223]UUX96808.1 Rieske 2Fe-2S domain-containing protein [Aquabacterium sp. J223]